MAGPGAGSARRPEPTAAQVAAGGPRGGQCPSHGLPPRPGSRQPGALPGSMGGRGSPRKAAPGRLLRLFPSAALLRPSLRPLFSYSEGSRGAAEGKGRSGREPVGRVPPVRRRFPPGSSTADRGRAGAAPVGLEGARSAADRGRAGGGRSDDSKRRPARAFDLPPRTPPAPKRRNDAIPRTRTDADAPERHAPATSSTPLARPEAPAPAQYPTCPPPGAANTPGSPRPPSSPTPPPSPHRRRARNRTPRSASTSHNPRARLPEVRARGLSDDLAGYVTCSRVKRRSRRRPSLDETPRRRPPGPGRREGS